jgi:uncharacterized protein DUF6510
MDALDGNAIAGLLQEVFGHEMTIATGVCTHCGNEGLLAECRVYVRAPGVVVRCRTCDAVLAVIIEKDELHCVDLQGLSALRAEGAS